MAYLETNLKTIARLAKRRENQNYKFRAFLKMQDDNKVDPIVHRLHREITEAIDCTKCGNCCKTLHPSVTKEEISRLAKALEISDETFGKRHLKTDNIDHEKFMSDSPCIFLDSKRCSIYPDRPEVCREYPFTGEPEFTSRTFNMIFYYEICPIVFNLMEQLKVELGFFDDQQHFDW